MRKPVSLVFLVMVIAIMAGGQINTGAGILKQKVIEITAFLFAAQQLHWIQKHKST